MRLLLDETHVVSVPGSGGHQHVFPPQYQDAEILTLKLRHNRQQLQQHMQYFDLQ